MARAVRAPEQQRTGVQRFLADLVDPALHVTGRQGNPAYSACPNRLLRSAILCMYIVEASQ